MQFQLNNKAVLEQPFSKDKEKEVRLQERNEITNPGL